MVKIFTTEDTEDTEDTEERQPPEMKREQWKGRHVSGMQPWSGFYLPDLLHITFCLSSVCSVSSVVKLWVLHPDPRNTMPPQRHANILRLHVEVEAVVSAVASDPAVFDATERCRQVTHVLRVDPDHAGL
jgi:hypothetical protein